MAPRVVSCDDLLVFADGRRRDSGGLSNYTRGRAAWGDVAMLWLMAPSLGRRRDRKPMYRETPTADDRRSALCFLLLLVSSFHFTSLKTTLHVEALISDRRRLLTILLFLWPTCAEDIRQVP